ncbi:hypothetical protein QQX98_009488 [Neonectria punicea]|uniref:Uncharacterized protein n=1 Tax=Neonectria punicea TaxID=979145 RepID=A0ABR1GSH0_9HYPO
MQKLVAKDINTAVAEIALRNIPEEAPKHSVDEAIPTGVQDAVCCEAGLGNGLDEAGSGNVLDKGKGKAVENIWPSRNATGADTTASVPAVDWSSSTALVPTDNWTSSATPASVDKAIATETPTRPRRKKNVGGCTATEIK